MSMQVSSILRGGAAIPVQKEYRQEKPQSIPMERREAQAYPGTPKNQASELKQTVSELENISLAFNRRLKFVIDQDSNQLIIKVIDNETDKVVKVLPPEELQRLHSRIRETIGFLFDRLV